MSEGSSFLELPAALAIFVGVGALLATTTVRSVTAKPPSPLASSQHEGSVEPPAEPTVRLPAPKTQRRAIAPADLNAASCSVPDRGLGDRLERRAQGITLLSRARDVTPQGTYSLLVHFHGGGPVRKILAPLDFPLVVATLDKGETSSAYAGTFTSAEDVDALIAQVDREITEEVGRPARADRITISSFSAGYQAVREWLTYAGARDELRGVVLLDSLYGSFVAGGNRVDLEGLAPFTDAAMKSLTGDNFVFYLSHSQVRTTGYADTESVASALIEHTSVRSQRLPDGLPGDRTLQRVADERGFYLRGYGGADGDGHCAHLALLPDALQRVLSATR